MQQGETVVDIFTENSHFFGVELDKIHTLFLKKFFLTLFTRITFT